MAAKERQMGNMRDKEKRMTTVGKVVILALFCTILLEGILALYRVGRGYGAESARFFLESCEHHDYMIVPVPGAVAWSPTGPDPWLRFDVGQGVEAGHIRLLFAEPLLEDTAVHLYYARDGRFDRFRRMDGYLLKGSSEALLTIPPGSWDSLRLDILGGFALEGIEAAEAVPLKELFKGDRSTGRRLTGPLSRILGQVRWGRAAVLFLFLTAAISLIAGRRGEKAAEFSAAAAVSRGEKVKNGVESQGNGERKTGGPGTDSLGTRGPGADDPGTGARTAKRERILYLDGIRALAAFLVIAAHVLAPLEGQPFHRGSSLSYLLFLGCMFFALTCNLLFFMLSGALLLPYREESAAEFIRKRFLKVVLPLLVYSIFYVRGMCFSVLPWKDWVISYGKALFSGQVTMAPHLWLVYALIGMYVLVLPLRALLKDVSERTEKQLAFLTILFLGIRTAGQYLGQEPAITIPLDGWPGIFLMGYFLTRDWMRPYDHLWLKGGAAAFLISLGTGMLRLDYGQIVYNCSLLMLAMASALFLAVRKLEPYLSSVGPLLSAASRYSYSVLLIHWYVLYGLVYNGLLPGQMPLILKILLPILACAILSLALSALVDRTVVAVLERAVIRGAEAGKRWKGLGGMKQQ